MNKMTLMQVWGMARYEFRMHWRRRGLKILAMSVLGVVGISILISGDSFQQLKAPEFDSAVARQIITSSLILISFSPIGISMVFVLPIVAAETIPLDRQYGVRDLLDALPLSPNAYLTGKLLGLWLAILSGMGLVMLLLGALWWLKAGVYNFGEYAEAWLVGIGSLVVLNGSLGVLLPATQPSRRMAIIVTMIGMFILGGLFGGVISNLDTKGLFSIVRTPILNYYLFSKAMLGGAPPSLLLTPTFETVLLTIGAGLAQIVVIFALIRLWMNWQYEQN